LKIIRGLSWNYAAYGVEAAIGLALVAFVVRRVGVPDYGVLVLALSITSLLTLLDLGLLGLLVQAYTSERQRAGAEAVSRLLSASVAWLTIAGLAAFVISGAIAMVLPGPFKIDAPLVHTAAVVIAIVGAAAIVSLPSTSLELAYVASSSFGALGRVQMVVVIARAVATFIIIGAGHGVIALAWVHLGTAALRFVLLLGGLERHAGGARLSIGKPDFSTIRSLRANRPWATGDNIARQLATAADSILLGAMASQTAVATYGIAKRIPGQLLAVTNRGVDVTFPVLAEHHTRNESADLRRLFVSTLKVTAAFLLPVCLAGILFAPQIIVILAGNRYIEAVPMLRWLLAATMIQALSVPAYSVLYARGEISTAARIAMLEAIANISITMLLIPRYGGTGAAAATAITHTIGTLGWFFPAALKATRAPAEAAAG
jgi:O-antigen/teichoic acid export membrane protein